MERQGQKSKLGFLHKLGKKCSDFGYENLLTLK